jgi:hypothetical protein
MLAAIGVGLRVTLAVAALRRRSGLPLVLCLPNRC